VIPASASRPVYVRGDRHVAQPPVFIGEAAALLLAVRADVEERILVKKKYRAQKTAAMQTASSIVVRRGEEAVDGLADRGTQVRTAVRICSVPVTNATLR
jgi:hypothetical protein